MSALAFLARRRLRGAEQAFTSGWPYATNLASGRTRGSASALARRGGPPSVVSFVRCLRDGGVATSGIGKRSWLRPDGGPAHHLIDPATGDPAFTGIVQVTAIAPTGVLAEALSKASLLSGPAGAERWLTRGGVIVYDDGSHRVVEPA